MGMWVVRNLALAFDEELQKKWRVFECTTHQTIYYAPLVAQLQWERGFECVMRTQLLDLAHQSLSHW